MKRVILALLSVILATSFSYAQTSYEEKMRYKGLGGFLSKEHIKKIASRLTSYYHYTDTEILPRYLSFIAEEYMNFLEESSQATPGMCFYRKKAASRFFKAVKDITPDEMRIIGEQAVPLLVIEMSQCSRSKILLHYADVASKINYILMQFSEKNPDLQPMMKGLAVMADPDLEYIHDELGKEFCYKFGCNSSFEGAYYPYRKSVIEMYLWGFHNPDYIQVAVGILTDLQNRLLAEAKKLKKEEDAQLKAEAE